MRSSTAALAFAYGVTTVAGHGFVTSPQARMPGSAMAAACGTQVEVNQESDNYGNIQGELQIAASQTDYDAAACDIWLCKGYKFADNKANVQSYKAGEKVAMTVDIRAPHTGVANVSIVETASNTVIAGPLISWDVYASNSYTIPENNTDFSITIPSDLGSKCATAGDCVIQWFWNAASIDQTYESCIDFTVGSSGSGSGSGSESSAVPVSSAPATSVAASSVAAVASSAPAVESSAAPVSSVPAYSTLATVSSPAPQSATFILAGSSSVPLVVPASSTSVVSNTAAAAVSTPAPVSSAPASTSKPGPIIVSTFETVVVSTVIYETVSGPTPTTEAGPATTKAKPTPSATKAPITMNAAFPSSILDYTLPTVLPTGEYAPSKALPAGTTVQDLLDWLYYALENMFSLGKKSGKGNQKHARDFSVRS